MQRHKVSEDAQGNLANGGQKPIMDTMVDGSRLWAFDWKAPVFIVVYLRKDYVEWMFASFRFSSYHYVLFYSAWSLEFQNSSAHSFLENCALTLKIIVLLRKEDYLFILVAFTVDWFRSAGFIFERFQSVHTVDSELTCTYIRSNEFIACMPRYHIMLTTLPAFRFCPSILLYHLHGKMNL